MATSRRHPLDGVLRKKNEICFILNELKLRAYGLVGNQNIPNFQYLTTYSTGGKI